MQKNIKLGNLNTLYSIHEEAHSSLQDKCEVFRVHLKNVRQLDELFNNGFRSDFFSIIHVIQGEVSVKLNSDEYEVRSNSMVVATPNSFKLASSYSDDCELEGICFTIDFLKSLWPIDNLEDILSFLGNQLSPYWEIDQNTGNLISDLFNKLNTRLQQVEQHSYGQELVRVCFTECLFEIAEIGNKYSNLSDFQYGRKEDLVSKFVQLARKYYIQQRKLSFYADQLHVTSKHLSETVKEITGKPAGKILDDLYLVEAKILIENRTLSISQISDQLNFSSPDIFSRFFHRMEGCSPSQYRSRFSK